MYIAYMYIYIYIYIYMLCECMLRVLRRIFGLKRDEKGSGEGSTMKNFIVCTVHLI